MPSGIVCSAFFAAFLVLRKNLRYEDYESGRALANPLLTKRRSIKMTLIVYYAFLKVAILFILRKFLRYC